MWILYWENELGKLGYFHAKGRKDPKLKHRVRLVYSLSEAKASGLAREDERDWQNVEKKCRDIRPYVSTFFLSLQIFTVPQLPFVLCYFPVGRAGRDNRIPNLSSRINL